MGARHTIPATNKAVPTPINHLVLLFMATVLLRLAMAWPLTPSPPGWCTLSSSSPMEPSARVLLNPVGRADLTRGFGTHPPFSPTGIPLGTHPRTRSTEGERGVVFERSSQRGLKLREVEGERE